MGNSLKHPLHQHELKLMKSKKVNDDTACCEVCHGAFLFKRLYGCDSCALYMHRLCAQLLQETEHPWHKGHVLALRPGENNQFNCGACGVTGEGIRYDCKSPSCEFSIHPLCAFLPPRIETHQHQHLLVSKIGECYTCSICDRDGSMFVHYSCQTCSYAVHPYCLLEESNRKQLPLYRRSKRKIGRKLVGVATRTVLLNLALPVIGVAASAALAIEAGVLAAELTGVGAKLNIGNGGKYLKMTWNNLPGFSDNDQNKKKIIKELIMLFAIHICRMNGNQSRGFFGY